MIDQPDVILFVCRSTKRFSKLTEALVLNGTVLICWPRKASVVITDLNENVIREIGLAKVSST